MTESARCIVSIADLIVEVTCNDRALLESLRDRYAGFCQTEAAAQFKVQIDFGGYQQRGDLTNEPIRIHGLSLGIATPCYTGSIDVGSNQAQLTLASLQPLGDIDYFLRLVYALLIFREGGLLMHSAGIVRDDQAYLFFGHSGSGKTTVARLSTDALILNDDLLMLKPNHNRWQAHSTPFWNPTQVHSGGRHAAPIASMFRLIQDREVFVEAMSPAQATAELVSAIPIIPMDPASDAVLLDRLQQLLQAAPAYRLHFLPDASFWPVVTRVRQPVSPTR
jgi:hypothetical protein